MIQLQRKIVYGPVHSRRLGISLGLNILPTKIKVCSFDCLYCQYGWTDEFDDKTLSKILPSKDEILEALETQLKEMNYEPDYITFSGNGEATLHPEFGAIVDGVIELRNKYTPHAKTTILSNTTQVFKPEVREALAKLDERIMKLDAGYEYMFSQYNRPAKYVNLDVITDELSKMDGVTIQTLFTSGPMGNYIEKNILAWIERIKKINPVFVQIYSLDRGYPSEEISYVSKEELGKIKELLDKENIKSEVY
jgi:wyosine [tRNA(Phe)-imidazoG37] synthetase (radical SAM superfamily)